MTALRNNQIPVGEHPDDVSRNAFPTTPVTEEGVRAFFEGLAALQKTMERGAPGRAAVAVTPGLVSLLERFCSRDGRYLHVMANVFTVDYAVIKRNMLLDCHRSLRKPL